MTNALKGQLSRERLEFRSNLHGLRELIRVLIRKIMRSPVERSWRKGAWSERSRAVTAAARNGNHSLVSLGPPLTLYVLTPTPVIVGSLSQGEAFLPSQCTAQVVTSICFSGRAHRTEGIPLGQVGKAFLRPEARAVSDVPGPWSGRTPLAGRESDLVGLRRRRAEGWPRRPRSSEQLGTRARSPHLRSDTPTHN